MNIELMKQALAKVVNPNILVNMVSKRVRQLNSSGAASRPLVENTANQTAVEIALREIIEDKMTFDLPVSKEVLVGAPTATPKRRRKAAASSS